MFKRKFLDWGSISLSHSEVRKYREFFLDGPLESLGNYENGFIKLQNYYKRSLLIITKDSMKKI